MHHPSHYHSPLNLGSAKERANARGLAVLAAMTGYHHRGEMVYTEGAARWSGIQDHRLAYKGEFPRAADCSAFVTWCLWNAAEHFRIHQDFVNGLRWAEGYTGTMVEHGLPVDLKHLLTADALFWGGSHSVPQHTTIYVGHGLTVSHGSPGGPHLLTVQQMASALPFNQARRYIR